MSELETLPVDVAMLLNELKTKSAVIRHLTSLGWKRGQIAKELGIRYQHVRNVQLQPLKKTDVM